MEDKKFSRTLFSLFDRQRFEGDPRLAALIRETDARCGEHALPDDLLEQISAAGEVTQDLTELYPHMFQRQADGSIKILYTGGGLTDPDDQTVKLDGGSLVPRRPDLPDDIL